MKALYFDCSSGISGNMTIGALLELVDDQAYLEQELEKLNLPGYHLKVDKRNKNGIMATHVEVVEHHTHAHDHGENHHTHAHGENHHTHAHGENHHHEHRNLGVINELIDHSRLDLPTKDLAKRIFLRVAKAESKVHGKPLDQVHFHEVGAIDSIVDIVATAILINKINPDVIYASIVNDGYGFINCAHGLMSVPVPATSEIFSSSEVVYRQIDVEGELVTPTGAAIIAELACQFGGMPPMKVTRIGWGSGTKDLAIVNVLKVSLGAIADKPARIVVLETNIDDTTGEVLGYTMDQLFAIGALDVFFTPIYMKKNRPAYRLTVACIEDDIFAIKDMIFAQTPTIGIRYRYEQRFVLARRIVWWESSLGPIRLKVVTHDMTSNKYFEYEDLKEIATTRQLPLQEVIRILNGELSKSENG